MSQFHYSKIIATVGPSLAKETVLSKVINFVDVFRINLSHGFDDQKKKYIDTILKLDNSKTIILETKGAEIRAKNVDPMKMKKGDQIKIEYSEYQDEQKGTLFIDYPEIADVSTGAEMSFDESDVVIKIQKNEGDHLIAKVVEAGTVEPGRKMTFKNYKPILPFITEKDKKDIIWGIQAGVNILVVSYVKDENNILELREFLYQHQGKDVKVISKIETKEAIDNLDQIINASDGILLKKGEIEQLAAKKTMTEEKLVALCNKYGKPFILSGNFVKKVGKKDPASALAPDMVQGYLESGVDAFMLGSETAIGDEPIEAITGLYNAIIKYQAELETNYKMDDVHIGVENQITDYIIYNAYRTSKELDIKAIIAFTDDGYSVGRISTLKPSIPIIAFTKTDDTYKYLNLMRAVKGYKISNTFDYDNVKRIGKEIIRIIFKGNISLDDKILIMHASDTIDHENNAHLINGLELYKFKDI